MARNWLTIAKAEFYVLTVGMRHHRKLYTILLYALGLIWATYAAPMMMVGFITRFFVYSVALSTTFIKTYY